MISKPRAPGGRAGRGWEQGLPAGVHRPLPLRTVSLGAAANANKRPIADISRPWLHRRRTFKPPAPRRGRVKDMNLRKISFAISLAVVVETWVLFLYETSLKRAIGVYGVIFMLVPIGAWILVSPVITKRLREAGSKTGEPEVITRRFYRRFGPRYTVVGAVSTVIGVGLISTSPSSARNGRSKHASDGVGEHICWMRADLLWHLLHGPTK